MMLAGTDHRVHLALQVAGWQEVPQPAGAGGLAAMIDAVGAVSGAVGAVGG